VYREGKRKGEGERERANKPCGGELGALRRRCVRPGD